MEIRTLPSHRRPKLAGLLPLLAVLLPGCSTMHNPIVRPSLIRATSPSDLIVTGGGRQPNLDRLEAAFQAPNRLFDKVRGEPDQPEQQQEHERREAVNESVAYLNHNDVSDIYIDVDRYAPADQWQRLRENDLVSPAWKYTGGAVMFGVYTLFPGKVYHSDYYDPFTNTLYINSTDASGAVYAATSAKAYRQQWSPGTYWAMDFVTGVPVLMHASRAADAVSYAESTGKTELSRELKGTAAIEIAAEIGSEFIPF